MDLAVRERNETPRMAAVMRLTRRTLSGVYRPTMSSFMHDTNISILDGSTFLVSSANGDVDAGPDQPHGLFYKDMRHLSKWKLTIKGIALDVLSTDALEYYYAQHFCVPPTGTIYKNPTISIVRRRFVGDGFVEELTVLNHGTEAEEVELRWRLTQILRTFLKSKTP